MLVDDLLGAGDERLHASRLFALLERLYKVIVVATIRLQNCLESEVIALQLVDIMKFELLVN